MSRIKPDPEMYCVFCKARLTRKMMGKRLEDMGRFLIRKYCNRECMAKGMMVDDPSRQGYLCRARKHKADKCDKCGSTYRLSAHHRDRDWKNNAPENIGTLCASCHTTDHHEAGDINPRKVPFSISCVICGEAFTSMALPSSRPKTCGKACKYKLIVQNINKSRMASKR